jgi:hypothetical protein
MSKQDDFLRKINQAISQRYGHAPGTCICCGDKGTELHYVIPRELEIKGELLTLPINGTFLDRVKVGNGGDFCDSSDFCPDCGATNEQVHIPGCDVERCPSCKGQLISCACEIGPLPPEWDSFKKARDKDYEYLNGKPRPEPKHTWARPS